MKKAALFFNRFYVDAHPCFTELALSLVGEGYLVDLYYETNPFNPPPTFYNPHVRLYQFPYLWSHKLEFWAKQLAMKGKRYDAVFGTPMQGAILGWRVARQCRAPFFYLADEVYPKRASESWVQVPGYESLKPLEAQANRAAAASIALGQERYQIQRAENSLPADHRAFIIPNAQRGPAQRLRSHYFRDIFGLEDRKPILLFAGTDGWVLAKRLYEQTRDWGERDFHLVFHGRSTGMVAEKHPFILLSRDPLPSNLLNHAFSSADAGLALYSKDKPQEAKNGPTGGKLGAYLKNGLPLLAGNLDDFREMERQGVALFWDGFQSFDEVAARLLPRLPEMAARVPEYYAREFEYGKFFAPFADFLRERVAARG